MTTHVVPAEAETDAVASVEPVAAVTGAVAPKPVPAPGATATIRKHTLTLTFEDPKDLALLARIQKDAIEEDRSAPLNLLRFLRKSYSQG